MRYTVGDLRRAIEGLDDDMPVVISAEEVGLNDLKGAVVRPVIFMVHEQWRGDGPHELLDYASFDDINEPGPDGQSYLYARGPALCIER